MAEKPKKTNFMPASAGNNENLILRLLKQSGPLSQAQLRKMTGLQSSTTSYVVSRLREKGMIVEQKGQSARRGAKPVMVSLNPKGKYAAGAEINPNYILIGFFDFRNREIESVRIVTGSRPDPEQAVNLLEINLRGLLGKHEIAHERLAGIGVTLSGTITPDGAVELASPLGWKAVPLRQMLLDKFDAPVSVHTTKVRILAEISREPSLSSQNVLYFNIADGVGATMIIDGKLAQGSAGRAGEIGHIIAEPDGPRCGCGHKGCFETFISGPAIASKVRKDAAESTRPVLNEQINDEDLPEEVIKKISAAYQDKNHYAAELLDETADYVGKAAAVAINCFDPEVVILGGYVAQTFFNRFTERIKQYIKSAVYDNEARDIRIIPAAAGQKALITGVSHAVLDKYLGT